jgi:hypothetical protein
VIVGVVLLAATLFSGWLVSRSIRSGKTNWFGIVVNHNSSPKAYWVVLALDMIGTATFFVIGVYLLRGS